MMQIKNLIHGIIDNAVEERYLQYPISFVASDSRQCCKDSLFVALKGTQQDGTEFILQAVKNGAVCVACQEQADVCVPDHVCLLKVKDIRDFLFKATCRFYNNPLERMKCIAITGTNGKTTTSYLIESILNSANYPCGVIGTIDCHFQDHHHPLLNTTPDMIETLSCLAQMKEKNISHCVMEVSSHALDQGRLTGIPFKVGVFTNLTQDHLDYHVSMEDYFLAKAKLFETLSPSSTAVINVDDVFGQRLIEKTIAEATLYGLESKADISAKEIRMDLSGSEFILTIGHEICQIKTSLVGQHNVYNILAAAGASRALGIGLDDIKKGIEALHDVPGRLEKVSMHKNFHVFIDYAHTEDALKNVLTYLRKVAKARILVVFGCGGDRDKDKRKKMGKVAATLADLSIVTSDNPRSEDPQDIIHAIVSGFENKNYLICIDRREAIQQVLKIAEPGDIVLIAGKGHEDYQVIQGRKIPFDDRKIVEECLLC